LQGREFWPEQLEALPQNLQSELQPTRCVAMENTNPPNHITIESICVENLPVIKKTSKWRNTNRELYVSVSVDSGSPKSTKHHRGGGAMVEQERMSL
jgi:hypothetical protein